ncbi:MAG: PD-(D/E)XK nuclease domain-containing protein, partial [Treponema sp.]|nr:PD-(D/E)XK nuclease domain-containing protein [Treponema sp.]
YRPENADPTPLFYQSGYLTIKSWNQRQRSYKLGFPNAEVKYGFLDSLAPSYLHVEDKPAPFNIDILDDAVEEGDTDGMHRWFTALFALLPYPAGADTEAVTEQNFQNVIFMSLTMMGKYARTEVHSAKGRADCILETADYVYIFEFKRDAQAGEALRQIDEQGYAKPYSSDRRKIFKIGVNFSTKERNIAEWKVES